MAKEDALDRKSDDLVTDKAGVIVAFVPDAESADDLVQEIEGHISPEDMHLTLVPLGKETEVSFSEDELRQLLSEFVANAEPLNGRISGVGIFTSRDEDGDDIIYASFDSPDLPDFRQKLVDHLHEGGIPLQTDHGFTPHITLAYTQDRNTELDVPALEMTFDELVMMWGTHKEQFPLGIAKEVEMADKNDECCGQEERVVRGASLAELLNNAIEKAETDDKDRSQIITEIASAAGIESGTVNEILTGNINCPPLNRLEGFASVLDVSISSLQSAAESDGCSYDEDEDEDEERVVGLFRKFWREHVTSRFKMKRTIKDVDSWSGSPSNYSTTEAYCNASLIDVNAAAGLDEKVQSHCMLPIREEEDGSETFVRQAVFAAAGGRGITQVEKPDDVPQDAWETAVRSAANQLLEAYEEMDDVAPDSIFELAGKELPEKDRAQNKDEEEIEERVMSVNDIWNRVWEELEVLNATTQQWYWMVDIFADAERLFAVVALDGRLFRVPLSVSDSDEVTLGEFTQVSQQFVPTEDRTVVRQLDDGTIRVVQIVATATLNRVAQIDSMALFDSFIEHARETGEYPSVDVLHYNEIVVGRAIALYRDKYCYIAVWDFDDTDIGRAASEGFQEDPDYWGASIEFLPLDGEMVEVVDGVRIPVHTRGINKYITIAPETRAASWFTAQKSVIGRSIPMNEKDLQDLKKLVGDEEAEVIVQTVDRTNDQIDDDGMITRMDEDEETAETEVVDADAETDEDTSEEEVSEVMLDFEDDETAHMVAQAVVENELFKEQLERTAAPLRERNDALQAENEALQESVDALTERIAVLEESDEEKKERFLNDLPSRTVMIRNGQRPREKRNNDDEDQQFEMADRAKSTLDSMPDVG